MMISLPGYTGEAALVRESPYATLAHHGPRGLFINNRNYTIDGTDYVVVSSTPSQYVPSVTMVKLKEI